MLQAGSTWGLTGEGQTVAIIDSGIAYDHFALGGGLGANYRVVGGWDFAENDANPYDDGPLGFHGTHIAGIVGSSDPAHPGLAPQVDFVGLRVFDDHGDSDFDWIEQALWWVHEHRNSFEHPITTINMSLGGDWNDDEVPDWGQLEGAFAALKQDGIAIIASAGNEFSTQSGTVGLTYPAASPNVIPVASVDAQGNLSDFTQRHPRVLAALGEDVTSTVPDYLFGFDGVTDDYLSISGTSVSAPFVAGATVLLREAYGHARPEVTVTQDVLLNVLDQTADLVFDPITNQSYRRMNLERALASVMSEVPAPHAISWSSTNQVTVAIPARSAPTDYSWTSPRSGWYQISFNATIPGAQGLPEVYRGDSPMPDSDLLNINNQTFIFHAERGEAIRVRLPLSQSERTMTLARVAEFERGLLTLRGSLSDRPLTVVVGSTSVGGVSDNDMQVAFRGWLGPYVRPRIHLSTSLAGDGSIQLIVSASESLVTRSGLPRSPRAAPVITAQPANNDAYFAAQGSTQPVPLAVPLRVRAIDATMRRR